MNRPPKKSIGDLTPAERAELCELLTALDVEAWGHTPAELLELIQADATLHTVEGLAHAFEQKRLETLLKLIGLREECGIEPGPGAGWKLALHLAQRSRPEFSARSRGRPRTWTTTAQLLLAGEAYRARPALPIEASLPIDLARALAQRTTWKALVRGWSRGTRGADPGEALARAYAAIPSQTRSDGRALWIKFSTEILPEELRPLLGPGGGKALWEGFLNALEQSVSRKK